MEIILGSELKNNISHKYFNYVTSIYHDYMDYIQNYNNITIEYYNKLSHLTNNNKLKNVIKENENESFPLFKSINKLMKIINTKKSGIKNEIEWLDKSINSILKIYNNLNIDNITTNYETNSNSYNNSKKNLIQEYENLMNSYNTVEINLSKYFIKKRKKEDIDESSREINISTKLAKDNEMQFIKLKKYFEIEKKIYKKQLDEFISQSINISDSLSKELKKQTMNLSGLIKNDSIILSNCIDELMKNKDLQDVNYYQYILDKINSKCGKDIKDEINIKNYLIKITNNNIIKYTESKPSLFGKSNSKEIIDSLNDQEVYEIIKIMHSQFQFIGKNEFDIEFEKKKYNLLEITNKIFFYELKNFGEYQGIKDINRDEFELLIKSLPEEKYRIAILERLNYLKEKVKLEIPNRQFEMLSILLLGLCDYIRKDFNSAKLLFSLSSSFYITKDSTKTFIVSSLLGNEVFKNKEFWNDYINYNINEEVQKFILTSENNGKEVKIEEIKDLVFNQLSSLLNNAKNLLLNIEVIKEITEPIIKKYKLSEENANFLYSSK